MNIEVTPISFGHDGIGPVAPRRGYRTFTVETDERASDFAVITRGNIPGILSPWDEDYPNLLAVGIRIEPTDLTLKCFFVYVKYSHFEEKGAE